MYKKNSFDEILKHGIGYPWQTLFFLKYVAENVIDACKRKGSTYSCPYEIHIP